MKRNSAAPLGAALLERKGRGGMCRPQGAEAQAAAHADAADRASPGTHRGHEAKQRGASGRRAA